MCAGHDARIFALHIFARIFTPYIRAYFRRRVEVQVFAGAVKDIVWDNESKKICAVGERAALAQTAKRETVWGQFCKRRSFRASAGDGKGVVAKVFVWDTGNNATVGVPTFPMVDLERIVRIVNGFLVKS